MRAAAALLALLLLAGCKTELNHGLDEREANEIVALLLKSGIPASREMDAKDHTMTVYVAQDRFAEAVDIVSAHGLPRTRYASIPDVFKGGSLVASPLEERAKMIYALEEGLAHSISDIDGVLTARVNLVLPDNDPLRRDTTPSSASVLIRYAPGTPIERLTPQIKLLVANGVSGLTYDNVTVVLSQVAADTTPRIPASDLIEPVAGLWVAHDSVAALQAVLVAGAGLLAMLAGLAGWLAWRLHTGGSRALVPR
jgi:type III secretion protein J